MTTFRAKLTVDSVTLYTNQELIKFNAKYNSMNSPEDNSYSKYTPSASLEMSITNPALLGTIKPGQQFYVDFTSIEKV